MATSCRGDAPPPTKSHNKQVKAAKSKLKRDELEAVQRRQVAARSATTESALKAVSECVAPYDGRLAELKERVLDKDSAAGISADAAHLLQEAGAFPSTPVMVDMALAAERIWGNVTKMFPEKVASRRVDVTESATAHGEALQAAVVGLTRARSQLAGT